MTAQVFPIIIIIIHGIPASIVILLLFWGIRVLGYKEQAKLWLKWLFAALGLYILTASAIVWYTTNHTNRFTIGKRYKITLHSSELYSFLDWLIQFDIKVKDERTGKEKEFEFTTPDGPYLKFYSSTKTPNLILIRGVQTNSEYSWLIDMGKGEIKEQYVYGKEAPADYREEVELTGTYDIVNK